MEEDLPYRTEYAKSNRASCKGCKQKIGQDSLRIARMVQSGFHDGKQPNWFHESCFFKKLRPTTEGDIGGFELLRYEDQKRIKEQISSSSVTVTTVTKGKGKGKKRTLETEVVMTGTALKDYGIEYSASGRAGCRGCEQKILKNEIRIKRIVYDTEVGMKYGGQPLWHHLDCFAKLRTELQWYAGGEQLPGFNALNKDDQKKVLDILPSVKADEIVEMKKLKAEPKDEVDSAAEQKLEKLLQKQSEEYYKMRDKLKNKLKKSDWIRILEKNHQSIPEGNDAVLDATCDIMTFGTLLPCPKCKGQFSFSKSIYICTGDLSEWVKCDNKTTEPPRVPCKIPSYITTDHSSFAKEYKVKNRAVKYIAPSVSSIKVKKEENSEPKVKRERPPLYKMEFALIGKSEKSKDEIKKIIESFGGKLTSRIHEQLAAVISNKKEIDKMNVKISDAQSYGIQVIPESFLDEVKGGNAIQLIKSMDMSDWGKDPEQRIPKVEEEGPKEKKSMYTKSVQKSVTLKVKDGTSVDPDSGLQDEAHVFIQGKKKYFAVLCKSDIQKDKNSYYKLQLLEANNSRKYYIFRAWGRIGTTIGGNKVESFYDVNDAIDQFLTLYREHTGNSFGTSHFKKVPGKYNPIDVEYGDEKSTKSINDRSEIKSKLVEPVQDLIKLIFDLDLMRKAMLEFDLDMEKMPLGKLSQKQLAEAMKVLNEISELVKSGGSDAEFIGKSNQFYSLVPHDFGTERPLVIDTTEKVTTKTEMIEALMEIEIAYGLLQTETGSDVCPIDGHYDQLKTEIKPMKRDSDEFILLEKYVQNTHAETHKQYKLIVEEIFKVTRKGEERRYKPFKKLHNRKLLWHGSRLTNFVGILSHGLKIAPPEAPATGYMFGKGIYFADMVSKSANYCCTSPNNSTGLMLLCEVALGDMEEFKNAKYVTQLPKNKHSVKGIGKTCPNPSESHCRADGVEIPLGKPMTEKTIKSSLLYNEYIVYDVAQVNVQYLFKMNFEYNH